MANLLRLAPMTARVASVYLRCFGNESLAARVRELQADRDDPACNSHEGERGVPVEEVAKLIDEIFRPRYVHATAAVRMLPLRRARRE